MEALLLLVAGAINVACFMVGVKAGKEMRDTKTPPTSHFKPPRAHRVDKDAQTQKDKLETILRNVECYDGTGYGQEDVPGS
jgi:hypothetical protein